MKKSKKTQIVKVNVTKMKADLKPKRKLKKWEKLFVEKHGIELCNELRETFPELKHKPSLWKTYLKMGEYLGVDIYASILGDESNDDEFVMIGGSLNGKA